MTVRREASCVSLPAVLSLWPADQEKAPDRPAALRFPDEAERFFAV